MIVPPLVLEQDPHPLLRPVAFLTWFPRRLGEIPTPPPVLALLDLDAEAPLRRTEEVRRAVRDLLRHWGHKAAGRGKPAAEYLVRAASEGTLDSINVAVDICNAVSLHSGFSIALLDLDLLEPPLRIARGQPGERYVFNRSGQEMDLEGLICLYDARGPCANPVKDAQRAKTHPDTRATLTILWGTTPFEERCRRAYEWYRGLLEALGAQVTEVPVRRSAPGGNQEGS